MFLETFFQDLRIGLRVLVKEKSFCALAVFVLAVGIAAVTTQYAIVNGVLLRGFNFRDAERLVDVQLADPVNFTPNNFNSQLTTADFADLREQQKSFSEFVGYLQGSTVNLTWNGQPKRLQGGYITHDFFRALGVAPVLGRDFLPEEDRAGVDKAVLLSDALWHTEFGADPGVIGKAVRVNGRTGTIIGVMPPKFKFPTNEDLWIPVNAEFPVKPRNDRGINFISIIARLKPGVTMEQATAEITNLAQGFAKAYPDTNKPYTMGYIRPLIAAFTGPQLNGLLFTMLAFCVGVLLIACVNVMNMQFARATLRAKELAIRSSLGATRVRLIRQMLTESLLVAAIGAAIGVGIAFWATDYLDVALHVVNPIPAWMTFEIDAKVLLVVVGATMLSAVVSGFVPAWLSSRTSAIDALKESGRGNTGRAVAVALTNRFRMVFSNNSPVEIEGKEYKIDTDRTTSELENITPGYHAVLGQKLLEGRELTEADSDQKLPVAVVNATFAKKHFGNVSPLNRRFRTTQQNGTQPGPWRVIVGVVSDVYMAGPFNTKSDGTGFYLPYFAAAFGPVAPAPVALQFGTAIFRPPAGQRPEALAQAVQHAVNQVDPNLPLYFVSTPKAALDTFLSQVRLTAVMFGIFGVIAVILASVGLYGVMSFSVNQRSQEFGVRMALGADAARILRMVLRQGVWQLGLGLGAGLLITLGIATLANDGLTNFFYQTNPRDPLTYGAVALLIMAVSLIAILIPARRATRVSPMTALRAE